MGQPPRESPVRALNVGPALSRSSCTLMDLCRSAQPRRRCVRCEGPKCTWARRSQFSPAARFRRPRPSPGVHRAAAAGPWAGDASRLGFFDLACNEWFGAYTFAHAQAPRGAGGSLIAPTGSPTGRARPDASIGLSGIPPDSRESASVADGGLSEASPCDQAPAGASRFQLDRLRVEHTP